VNTATCENIFPNVNMRRITNFLFIAGLLVTTHGIITRCSAVRQFALTFAGPGALEDDPRFTLAFLKMIIEVGTGGILLSVAAFLFNRPHKKVPHRPPTERF
jgi:hypothetical protein